jgi:hypothetical protein
VTQTLREGFGVLVEHQEKYTGAWVLVAPSEGAIMAAPEGATLPMVGGRPTADAGHQNPFDSTTVTMRGSPLDSFAALGAAQELLQLRLADAPRRLPGSGTWIDSGHPDYRSCYTTHLYVNAAWLLAIPCRLEAIAYLVTAFRMTSKASQRFRQLVIPGWQQLTTHRAVLAKAPDLNLNFGIPAGVVSNYGYEMYVISKGCIEFHCVESKGAISHDRHDPRVRKRQARGYRKWYAGTDGPARPVDYSLRRSNTRLRPLTKLTPVANKYALACLS